MSESSSALTRARSLPCWSGQVSPEPLTGGITNHNFAVRDGDRKYFVRIGDDIAVHGILRVNEQAAAKAAAAVGISPPVVFAEPGVMVTDFLEARTYQPEDLRRVETLPHVVELIRRCHRQVPDQLRGSVAMFWVFQVIRSYAGILEENDSRSKARLPALRAQAERFETIVGPIEVVFGHNDLLAANFLDDGSRLWLVDWDYAGFNSPLFDLANVASNNEFSTELIDKLLETYFERPPDDELRRRFEAMACASLLREAMWSMVSEIFSTLDFDYVAYTEENLARYESAARALGELN